MKILNVQKLKKRNTFDTRIPTFFSFKTTIEYTFEQKENLS